MRRAEGQRQMEDEHFGWGERNTPPKPLTPKELEERRRSNAERAAEFFPESENSEQKKSSE